MIGLDIARWAQSLQRARQPFRGYHNLGSLQLQAGGETEAPQSLEAEAMAVERAFTEEGEAGLPSLDVGKLAEMVYGLFRREVRLENERRGGDRL